MARYIDEKDVYKLLEPTGIARVHCSQIDELPRGDVVPKSEVDKWHNAYKAFRKKYLDCKNEAEELDDEVERLKKECLARCHHQSELLKKYNACKTEVAREIFTEIEEVFRQHTEGGYYLNGAWFPERLDLYTGDAVVKLKKKYMEEYHEIS